jgi:FkbM family methyltransferase
MSKVLAFIKQQLLTLGGIRSVFPLSILDRQLKVGYTLRSRLPERDYSIILQLATGKKCAYDVGANHGIISLLLVSKNPDLRVHSFEASEEAVNIINQNSTLNGFNTSIRVINTLIADRSGYTIPFYWEGASGGASITKDRLGHTTEIHKSTLSLDDYAKANDAFPDFIKMDIEGAENIAIKGMKEILSTARPDVFIELHDFGTRKLYENAQDILDVVAPLNYQMIYLRTGKPLADTNILKNRGRCHVVLQPKERYSEDYFASFDLKGL